MGIWQAEAEQKMKDFLHSIFAIQRIETTGSILTPELMDIFSDVDLEIHLSSDDALDMMDLVNSLAKQFGNVFGYEVHFSDSKDLLRVCFENGWKFDLCFIYSSPKKLHVPADIFEEKVRTIVNQFWFMSFMVLVKLGRKDNLIAAHLVLELCQLVIVVQMLMRDVDKDTNIHRFGDNEDVPTLRSLSDPNANNTATEVLGILFQAADNMDKICTELDIKHVGKTDVLRVIQGMFLHS